jgi:plastocyanin
MRIAASAAVLAALVVLAPAPAGARTSKTFPTRVQVTAKEFWYALSSRSVKSGPAVIEFVNFGQDPHDMRVQKIGTTKVYSVPTVQPDGHYDLSIDLSPGRYLLWCSIANHKQLGMQATLIVKPKTA